MNWLSFISKIESLQWWTMMQCIKGTSTLRTSTKGKKSPLKIVYRYGQQDGQIKKFLENRNFILKLTKEIKKKEKEEVK